MVKCMSQLEISVYPQFVWISLWMILRERASGAHVFAPPLDLVKL